MDLAGVNLTEGASLQAAVLTAIACHECPFATFGFGSGARFASTVTGCGRGGGGYCYGCGSGCGRRRRCSG